jgi:hypothetical protein
VFVLWLLVLIQRLHWTRPVLLDISSGHLPETDTPLESDQGPHPDENQVLLDTKRSFVHYPRDLSISEKDRIQDELNELIVGVLRRCRGLRYFQVRVII